MYSQIELLLSTPESREELLRLIKHGLQTGADFKGLHIDYAHVLLLQADWLGITQLMPGGTNILEASGWLTSLASGRPVNARREPIPWLTYPAIDFLDSVVKSDWLVFEWGAGNSTRWWSKRVHHVYSMESNAEWCDEVKSGLAGNVTLSHRDRGDEYVDFIGSFEDNSFDVIVIDADHRNNCAKAAVPKLKDNGFIVFDNSDSADFDEGVSFLCKSGLYRLDFWGLIPSYLYKNCTSVFFRDPEVLRTNQLPSRHESSVGMSCAQACSRPQENEGVNS